MDQAVIYQCACPAQVSRLILNLRELFAYQLNCLDDNSADEKTHRVIARAVEESHATMQSCLGEIFEIQGWDKNTLQMPDALKSRALISLKDGD
jgi:hypothetical protein